MALLDIIEAPHPILSARAREVTDDEFGPALIQLLADMTETMYAAPGVGLAAPQVSDSRRILVADPGFEDDEGKTKKGVELVAMVNPVIVERSRDRINWEESCLSVPEFYVDVARSKEIVVEWRDGEGQPQRKTFSDFAAVVLQHELDHLDGVTLLDRSSLLKRSRYIKKQAKRARTGGR